MTARLLLCLAGFFSDLCGACILLLTFVISTFLGEGSALNAFLERIEQEGLFSALEKGIFADIKRPKNGGKGLDGVSPKGKNYSNPFIDIMLNR